MKNKLARVAAWCCLAVGMGQSISAQAEEQGRFYGMLRSRDLTPFGFLRLDMRPAHAVSIENAHLRVRSRARLPEHLGTERKRGEVPQVARRFRVAARSARRRFRPSAICPARTIYSIWSPRRSTWRCTTRSRASGPRTPSPPPSPTRAASWTRPSKDSTRLRASTATAVLLSSGMARTSSTTSSSAKGVLSNAPKSPGFLDPTFGLRYSGISLPGPWQMSVETAVKMPFDGERPLLSTGHTDYGMQASVRRLGERNALHMDFAAVYYAGEVDALRARRHR